MLLSSLKKALGIVNKTVFQQYMTFGKATHANAFLCLAKTQHFLEHKHSNPRSMILKFVELEIVYAALVYRSLSITAQ